MLMSASAESVSRSMARSPTLSTPTQRPFSTTGSRRTARARMSCTASSTGVSGCTVTRSPLAMSRTVPPAGSPPDDDVAVGDDAGHGAAVGDHHVTDVVLLHPAGQLVHRLPHLDGHRVRRHDVPDHSGHGRLLAPGVPAPAALAGPPPAPTGAIRNRSRRR